MNRHSLRWGAAASGALTGFYVAVLAASGGWEHLRDQARTDWWLLAPIIVAFGTQVALSVELRHRHHAQHLGATTRAGTGASAVGMVACCAHHLVDLDLDIADTATLAVDGQTWTDPAWDGAGPGGHHREGTLTFTAAGPANGDAVLTIEGLDEPATAQWALPEGT